MTEPSDMDSPQLSQSVQSMPYAGFWWRWLAMFIDGIILQMIACPIGLVLGLGIGLSLAVSGVDKETINTLASLMGNIMGLILSWLFYTLLEASEHQATPGKMICKLKVVDTEGNRLTFGRANARYWAKIISTLPCMAGYIMAAFTQKKQALHDMIATTYVVKTYG